MRAARLSTPRRPHHSAETVPDIPDNAPLLSTATPLAAHSLRDDKSPDARDKTLPFQPSGSSASRGLSHLAFA